MNHLLKSGDICAHPSPENSRVKLLMLTDKGQALCEKSALPFLKAEEQAFARLTPEERRTLLELTRKHARYIREGSEILINDLHTKSESMPQKILEETNMLIRQETSKDYDKVDDLIKLAFETAEHSDGNEHDLANALRQSESFVPELALIAEIDGECAAN